MGPVGNLNTDGGKIFAGSYALFSGLAFITSIGIIFTPIYHRFMHKFHLEDTENDEKD
jgi:NADH:ubiquinone oxidoreductase subunit 4 (subunit M)